MTDQKRESAVHAVDVLNDFIGDLIGGTMLFRYWHIEFRAGRVPEKLMVNIQKMCVSVLVLGLCKFVEFYKRFQRLIPSQYSKTCKDLAGKIERKGGGIS